MSSDIIKIIQNTENAPNKLGPYTQCIAFSHYNNISAQLHVYPKSGKMITGGVKEQARQCLNNIKSILESIDHPINDIVKITIFHKNLSDIDLIDEVYSTFFPNYVPARSTVSVSALAIDALVQIEAVVSHGDGTPPEA